MKQKTKFKQTEIGKIPEDWDVKKLIQITEKDSDIVAGPFGSNLKVEDYQNTGYPIIRLQNIERCRFVDKDIKYVDGDKFLELKYHSFLAGDIVMAKLGIPIGKTCIVPQKYSKGIVTADVVRIRLSDKQISKYYLLYILNYDSIRNQLSGRQLGTTRPRVNLSDVRDLLIPVPPLPEQTAIAKILSSLDTKIELNKKINQILESIGTILFKKWFVDERKKEWEETSLDKIAHFLNGLALQKYPAKGKDYLPAIKIRELNQGITENTDKIDINLPAGYIIEDGDILFSWSGSLDVVIWGHGRGALNQHLYKVTSEKYPKWFYYYWTKYHLPEFQRIAAGKATTMGHIKRNHLEDAECTVPDKKALEDMNKIFKPLIEKQIRNLIEIRKLSMIKNLLLPKLMSGEIRVK